MEDFAKNQNSQSTDKDWNTFWKNKKNQARLSWSKKRILTLLKRSVKPGMKVLDAGSGSGVFSKWFNDAGCITVSLDYSEEALNATKQHTDGKSAAYISDDLTDPELPDRSPARFDLIFSDGLFEHFESDAQDIILRNMIKLLQSNGKIVTFVPNLWSPWTVIRPLLMKGIKETAFTHGKLLKLYGRNNCKIISSGGINVLPVSWSPEKILGKTFGMLVYSIGINADD